MACDLTRSRGKECTDILAGNSSIYLYDDMDAPFTVVAGAATAMNVALTANFSYALQGDGSTLEQAMVSDKSTGTRVNTQTITVVLNKMTALDAAEFNLLAASNAQCVVKDRAGNYHALGITEGMQWNVTATTGGAKTDASGYTLVGIAQEAQLAPILDSATTTAFLAVTTAV
tara:strand:+ start:1511 stop:2029 length:519 start_codon:yes stop_codon:yes gene_type:complete